MMGGDNKKRLSIFAQRKAIKWPLISVVAVIVAFGLIILGINIGNGQISFGRSNLTGLPSQLNYASVNQVYQSLRENYDGKLTESQVLNGIKEGLAASANDPYTEYFTPAEASSFSQELDNSFSGIGAELSQNSQGIIEIIAPIASTPAAKAGLQPDDLVTSINGQTTSGMTTDQSVNLIRGKAGTKVTLGIIRGNQQLSVTITRENITVPSVNTKILSGNIGYMQITTFANDTSTLAQQDAQQFANEHVKGIVLDLRNDPGGLVTAAVNVSSLWLPNGQTVFSERRGSTIIQTYYSKWRRYIKWYPDSRINKRRQCLSKRDNNRRSS